MIIIYICMYAYIRLLFMYKVRTKTYACEVHIYITISSVLKKCILISKLIIK